MVPFFVILLLPCVLSAINLYHHLDFVTEKVRDVLTNRFLPSEP